VGDLYLYLPQKTVAMVFLTGGIALNFFAGDNVEYFQVVDG
jgi:hypothetical protein